MEKIMVMVAMRIEDCPIQPPRPGNFWLGYVDSVEELQEERITLQNVWMYMNTTGVEQVQHQGTVRGELRQSSILVGICKHSPHTGISKLNVPKTIYMVIDERMKEELEAEIEEVSRHMMAARSNLVLAMPNVGKPPGRMS